MNNKKFIQSILNRIGQFGDGELEFETRDIERLCKIAQKKIKKNDLSHTVMVPVCDCNPNDHEDMIGYIRCKKCLKIISVKAK